MSDPGAPPPRSFRITVVPSGWCFEAAADRPLAESALAAGIALPVSCSNGTCRTCLCRATVGSVVYRVEWPGLFAEEKAEGWILPCVAHPMSDLSLEQTQARRLGD